MGWTTLSVRDETLERFNGLKDTAEMREPPSSDMFLKLLLNGWEHGTKADEPREKTDVEDLAERLDRIESAAREATSAAQSAEQAINEVTER